MSKTFKVKQSLPIYLGYIIGLMLFTSIMLYSFDKYVFVKFKFC